MKNLIELLQEHFTPSQRFKGLIPFQYLCDYQKPSVEAIVEEFPHLKLFIIDADRYYSLENVFCIRSRDIPRYSFLGNDPIHANDFILNAHLNKSIYSDLWSRMKLGGIALRRSDQWIVTTKKSWLIVSGCHRGGTTYATKTFQAAGLKVAHQAHGVDGIVSGANAATNIIDGATIIHQIRHPVRAIESIQGVVYRILKDFTICPLRGLDESKLLLSMKYWYWVHGLARLRSFWTYKVEDMESVWPSICERIGIDVEFPQLATNINTRKYPVDPIEWHDLYDADEFIAEAIRLLALEYGYE